MKSGDSAPPRNLGELNAHLDAAMELLRDFSIPREVPSLTQQSPASLLEQCLNLCAEYRGVPVEPVRTLHHFACTGGTLLSKCIATMPNTQMLSEIDPLSTMQHGAKVPHFAPTDAIQLLRQSTHGARPELLIELFLSNLALIHKESSCRGERLVLRDHAHSHFCTGDRVPKRPTLRELVAKRLPVRSIVTVRDPIDSFVALQVNDWVSFEPRSFDEYCARYLAFLDAYVDVPIVQYEAFVAEPQAVMRRICSHLELPFSDQFVDLFVAIKLTGDSGRTGEQIGLRPRRAVQPGLAEEIAASNNYRQLGTRLGYSNAQ